MTDSKSRCVVKISTDSLSHYRPTVDRYVDRLSTEYRLTVDRLLTAISTAMLTAISTDISVDITHSRQDPFSKTLK